MSTAVSVKTAVRGDSLLTGMAVMLALNVVQRGIGFARGILFCRLLADDALGQFSLSNSFLQLSAPLVVLGLPGSLGRYVEFYRQRGSLRAFLRRMTVVTVALTGVGVLGLSLCRGWLSAAVLGDASALRLMTVTLATLAVVVAFNYTNELLTALRQVRAVSWMQFVNSIAFTVIGLLLVVVWEPTAEAVVLAFGISCAAGMIAVAPWYGCLREEFAADASPLADGELWKRLLPFAAWVWLTNILANAADSIDRFMIIHWSGLDYHAAQSLVGQYHSSRVVPSLLITMAVTVAAIVLPYLSQAWEAGRQREVSDRTNLSVKLMTLAFTAVGLAVMWTSPVLFGTILGGKYDDGLAALPWALVSCIWFSVFAVAQNYLWCAEHARLGTLALAVGVVLNILLNLVSIPLGLEAIMAARSLATLAPAVLVLGFNWRHGMQWGRGLWLVCLTPLVLVCGTMLGTALFLAILAADWKLRLFFDDHEQPQLHRLLATIAGKLGLA